jgi:cytochrome c-type protein NapB
MKYLLKTIVTAVVSAAAWGLLGSALAAGPAQSMRGADVSATDAAGDTKNYVGKRPGSQAAVARTFSTQPPVIPHAVENFDEITLEDNQCLSCHGMDAYKKKNSPAISKSHLLDSSGRKPASSAARHSCVLCHVAQVDASPLVDNAFQGDVAAPQRRK